MARNSNDPRNNRRGRNAGTDSAGSSPVVVEPRGDIAGNGSGGVGGDGGSTDGTGGTPDGTGSGNGSDGGSRVIDGGERVVSSDDAGFDSGTGSASDGDGSGSPAKRKRGRPRKDASDGEAVLAPDAVRVNAPKKVGLSALGLGGDSGGVKFKDAYSGGAKLLFATPKYMGLGAHWPLDDDEADDLGTAIQAFVKTLPKSARAKWEKRLEKYFPALNLVIVAGMLTIPRAMATVELAKMERARRLEAAQQSSSLPVSSYGETSHAGPRSAALDLRDVVERHQAGPSENGAASVAGRIGEVEHDDGSERG